MPSARGLPRMTSHFSHDILLRIRTITDTRKACQLLSADQLPSPGRVIGQKQMNGPLSTMIAIDFGTHGTPRSVDQPTLGPTRIAAQRRWGVDDPVGRLFRWRRGRRGTTRP